MRPPFPFEDRKYIDVGMYYNSEFVKRGVEWRVDEKKIPAAYGFLTIRLINTIRMFRKPTPFRISWGRDLLQH